MNDVSEVEAGDVVAFQIASGDRVNMLLAVGAGDGKAIYVTQEGGWVVLSYMDQMENAGMFRWDAQ